LISLFPSSVYAADDPPSCTDLGITIQTDKDIYKAKEPIKVTRFDLGNYKKFLEPTYNYSLTFYQDTYGVSTPLPVGTPWIKGVASNFASKYAFSNGLSVVDNYHLNLALGAFAGTTGSLICIGPKITTQTIDISSTQCNLAVPPNIQRGTNQTVSYSATSTSPNQLIMRLIIYNDFHNAQDYELQSRFRWLSGSGFHPNYVSPLLTTNSGSTTIPDNLTVGKYTAVLTLFDSQNNYVWGCAVHPFEVTTDQTSTTSTPSTPAANPEQPKPGSGASSTSNNQCKEHPEQCSSSSGIFCHVNEGGRDLEKDEIIESKYQGIKTAIGCIPTEPKALIEALFKLGTGVGGGVAFLLMVSGVIQMMTAGSSANAQQFTAGKDRLTGAIIGLLFIIFSVLLLRIIGFDILGINSWLNT